MQKRMRMFLSLITLIVSIHCYAANDITFAMISDLHYGYGNMIQVNQATIDYLNTFPGAQYPAPYGGGIVDQFRGVCVLGDLTETGANHQWNKFLNDWGVNGEQRIKFPVYEGWGNHDGNITQYAPKGIKSRTKQRKNLTKVSENGFHYSWDWDNVHFVQLNRYTSQEPNKAGNSLGFLKEDLVKCVGTSGRPVILMQHYGFDDWSIGKWWSVEETNALYAAIKDYNVIAIFNGHTHSMKHIPWNGLDTYSDGSTKGWDADGGTCLIVHIKENRMRIFGLTPDGWRGSNYMWEKTFDIGNVAVSYKTKNHSNQLSFLCNRKLHLKMKTNSMVTLEIVDLKGKAVLQKAVSGQSVTNLGMLMSPGFYIVQAVCDGKKLLKRKIAIMN